MAFGFKMPSAGGFMGLLPPEWHKGFRQRLEDRKLKNEMDIQKMQADRKEAAIGVSRGLEADIMRRKEAMGGVTGRPAGPTSFEARGPSLLSPPFKGFTSASSGGGGGYYPTARSTGGGGASGTLLPPITSSAPSASDPQQIRASDERTGRREFTSHRDTSQGLDVANPALDRQAGRRTPSPGGGGRTITGSPGQRPARDVESMADKKKKKGGGTITSSGK